MKKISLYIGIGALFLVTFFSSCQKFDDLNDNPDATTEVSSSMLATNIILRNLRFNGRDAKAFLVDNAVAKYIGYANEGQMAQQYNSLGSGDFGYMTMLTNVEKMVEYAKGSVMEDSYKGLAKFSRAYMFYQLTMQMGDIPYSQANQGMDGVYRPKYDTQEEVLKGILDELKEADQFFAKGQTFAGDPTPYNGDPAKWRRASNAFALKVLMTLSKKAEGSSLNIKPRFAEIVAGGNLLQGNTGFLGLNYTTVNLHPLSGTNDLFTSRTIVSSLVIDNLKQLNDRRMYYWADPAGAKLAAGVAESDPAAYVGVDVSMDYSAMNAGHSANQYSLLNSRYLKEGASEPRMIMTYAEQQLILAEARVRGWITTGSAQEYYESGVKAALGHLMATKASYAHGKAIDQAYINNYFTGEAAFAATADEQLRQIWLQRYLLNFMQDPLTAYFDYRRHQYPEFPINPATSLNENNRSAIPMRWLYPGSETNYNRENLIEALNRQYDGYDEINKIMWVLK
ncbi:MAG TPA: SusD/RagB family nutrient-binding outer membrane lipoprotein [Chitinophagaceae bacterium]